MRHGHLLESFPELCLVELSLPGVAAVGPSSNWQAELSCHCAYVVSTKSTECLLVFEWKPFQCVLQICWLARRTVTKLTSIHVGSMLAIGCRRFFRAVAFFVNDGSTS